MIKFIINTYLICLNIYFMKGDYKLIDKNKEMNKLEITKEVENLNILIRGINKPNLNE